MAVISELKKKSKNLLDVSKAETGSLVAVDGANFESDNRARTPFVYLKKGTYAISMDSKIRATTMFFYSQPIASGYFIGKYATTPTIQNGRRVATFPVEQDCYLRCVFIPENESETTDLGANTLSNYNVMIEKGTTATEYEPYYLDITRYNNATIKNINFNGVDYHFARANEVGGKNLLDISKAENGTLASQNGSDLSVEQYPNRCRSGFIYLIAGSYVVSFNELLSTGNYLHRYSSNNQDSWLSSLTFTKSGSVSKFTLDSDCYIRFTIQPIDTSSSLVLNTETLSKYEPQLEKGSARTEYETFSGYDNNSRICEDAVNEPIIDMQIKGNSKQVLLPIEYQQVEYITNSGTQRIDTGLVPTNSTSIDITYQSMMPTGTSQYIAGSRTGATAVVEYAINGSSSNQYWDVRLNGATTTITDVNRMTNKYRSYLQLNNGVGTWTLTHTTTNTTYTKNISGAKVNATANLFLFAYNNIDANTHTSLRIYDCKIYEAGVLIRNFIPCYRKSDGVAGMYDLVEDKFYTNAGTGSFAISKDYTSEPTPETPSEIISVGEKTKNLFNKNDIDTTRHLTDGLADFNIANVKNYNCTGFIEVEPNTKYIKHGTLGSRAQAYFDENKNFIGTTVLVNGGATFTTPSNCKYIVLNLYVPNAPYDDVQLEKGSTATDYEPYGYKIPINTCGENLANENTVQENKLIGNSSNGIINDSTTYNTLYMEVEQGRTYVFKNFVRANGTTLRGCFYDSNGAWVSAFEETTVTIPSGVKYVGRSFSKEAENVRLYVVETTKSIYLNEPLRKIGDYADVLDYKNKKVIRKVAEKVFNGTETLSNTLMTNALTYPLNNKLVGSGLSSHFIHKYPIPTANERKWGEFGISSLAESGIGFFVLNSPYTEEEFKQFLANEYSKGTPVKVYYQLATPTEETIEVPEILTLDGTTTLEATTSIEPSGFSVKYWKQI